MFRRTMALCAALAASMGFSHHNKQARPMAYTIGFSGLTEAPDQRRRGRSSKGKGRMPSSAGKTGVRKAQRAAQKRRNQQRTRRHQR